MSDSEDEDLERLEPVEDPDFSDMVEMAERVMNDSRLDLGEVVGSDFAGGFKDLLWKEAMKAVYGEEEFKEWYRYLRFGDVGDTIEVENPCCEGTIEIEVDEMDEWGRGGEYDGKKAIQGCPGDDCTQNVEIMLKPGGEIESKVGMWIYER